MKIELLKSQNIALSKLETNKGQVEGLPKNPRLIKTEKFEKLKKSIEDNPEMLGMREVLVYPLGSKFVIIGGNMRFQACKELGFTEVPCKVLDKETTAEQLRAITIKDNVGFGEHDWELLANEWDSLELEEWGIDVPSFNNDEQVLEAEEDDYEVPDGGIETDIVIGDLFEIGEHRLLCGDSTDSDAVAKLMNGEKADMVFTDPPYRYKKMGDGGAFHEGHKKLKEDIKDIVNFDPTEFLNTLLLVFAKGINAYIFCNTDLVPDYCIWAKENKFNFNILTWHKKSFIPASNNHHFPDTEYLIYISKSAIFNSGLDVNYGKYFIIDNEKSDDHPTIKPLEIISNEIKIGSNINSLVFDFFLGSGSTMVAAHQLKRKCYGLELEPKYCQVIIDRMKKLDPTLKIKRNGQII
jgi:DNA modification methylase